MKKRIIEIEVNDEYVLGSGVVIGAAGADESVILRVAFSDTWAGLNIYATFRDSKGESPTVELLMPSMRVLDATVIKYDVVVPPAATAHAGKMSVVFSGFAVSEVSSYEIKTGAEENIKLVYRDAVINTTNAYFRVLLSDFSALDVKDHTEATVLEQVLSEINGFDEKETERRTAEVERESAEAERNEIFTRFCEDYSAGKFKGDKGDPGSVNVVQTTGDSELDAMSQKATTEAIGDLYDAEIPVGDITDGQYITPVGGADNNSSSCITDFVAVEAGYTLRLEKCLITENRSICGYDASKIFVECIAKTSDETEVTYTVPDGVCYIRVTGAAGVAPKVTKINHPISTDMDFIKKYVESVDKRVNEIITSEITPIRTIAGKFVNSQGGLTVDANSISHFISVLGGKTVVLSGVYANYSRAIVIYDENGYFKECVATNRPEVREFTIEVEKTSYIGFTTLNEDFSVRYKDSGIIKDEYIDFAGQAESEYIGNFIPSRRKINESELESGYLTAIGTVIASDNYRHTSFVEIEGGRDFTVTNFTPTANIAVIFFDGGKNIIGTVPHNFTGVAMEMDFNAPRNAAYIRFSLLTADADRVFVTYKEPVERNAHEKAILDGWFADSFYKITTLFGDYVKQPLITVIDDDTVDTTQVQTFKDVCDANGIKGTYACITKLAKQREEMTQLLLDFEKEGFHVCLHCYDHTNDPNIFSEKNFDPVAAEANIVQGCKDMLELGFADWRFWVTPGGESFPALQSIVRKWGFECAVTSDMERDVETTEAKYGRWHLCRPSWGQTAAHLPLEGWKARADEVVAKGGWLLVNTHMYGREADGWADPSSENRREFAEFVAYAKSIGCTFTTLNEAWRIKAPIYKFYELFV